MSDRQRVVPVDLGPVRRRTRNQAGQSLRVGPRDVFVLLAVPEMNRLRDLAHLKAPFIQIDVRIGDHVRRGLVQRAECGLAHHLKDARQQKHAPVFLAEHFHQQRQRKTVGFAACDARAQLQHGFQHRGQETAELNHQPVDPEHLAIAEELQRRRSTHDVHAQRSFRKVKSCRQRIRPAAGPRQHVPVVRADLRGQFLQCIGPVVQRAAVLLIRKTDPRPVRADQAQPPGLGWRFKEAALQA